MVSPSVSLLVSYIIEVFQLFAVQVLPRIEIGFFPKGVVHTGNSLIDFIPLPNFVVEYYNKFGEINVVCLPLLKSSIVGVFDGIGTKPVCN